MVQRHLLENMYTKVGPSLKSLRNLCIQDSDIIILISVYLSILGVYFCFNFGNLFLDKKLLSSATMLGLYFFNFFFFERRFLFSLKYKVLNLENIHKI